MKDIKKNAGDQGSKLAVLEEILDDTSGVQLRTAQSSSGTVEEDAMMAFTISLIEIDAGAIASGDIDINGMTAVMEKSTGGGAFSDAGITQPTFSKANGLVSDDYRFLAAEWQIGDVYKLVVSGIEAEINGDTVFVKAMIWSNVVLEEANIEAKIDTNQDLLDGTTPTPTEYRREEGVTQIKEFSITAAADAGLTTVATITDQPCDIKSIILHADTGAPAHLTSAAIEGGASSVIEFISAAVAIQTNLDAADKQVAWLGGVRLAETETITIDLQGTGSDAVDFTVSIKYRSSVDGGFLT